MKIWITKHSLTHGIIEKDIEAEIDSLGYLTFHENGFLQSYSKDEWCGSKEAAIEIAEKRIKKQITFLCSQIEKLEKLRFE